MEIMNEQINNSKIMNGEPELEESVDEKFYFDAKEYWSEIPATIDGMLGGFSFISQSDIKSSRLLLKQLFHSINPPDRKYALDCGAGIGRVTKYLLADLFEKVDLVDQNKAFLDQAVKYIGPQFLQKIGNFYCCGLQKFIPEPGKYDVIWVQWVLGHLKRTHLIKFLMMCRKGLKPNGVIIIKENVTSTDTIEMDEKDSSYTRPLSLLKELFMQSNLICYRQMKQQNFPHFLYSVYMFVLKPSTYEPSESDNTNEILQLE